MIKINGETLRYMMAASNNSVKVAELLIKKGADLN